MKVQPQVGAQRFLNFFANFGLALLIIKVLLIKKKTFNMEHLSKTVFKKTRHCYNLLADVTIVLFQAVSGISSAYQEYMYGHPYPSPYVCR